MRERERESDIYCKGQKWRDFNNIAILYHFRRGGEKVPAFQTKNNIRIHKVWPQQQVRIRIGRGPVGGQGETAAGGAVQHGSDKGHMVYVSHCGEYV